MSSDRQMTTRRIQICLCLLEVSLAMTIAVSAFFLLKFLPFSSSWPSRIYMTLAGILIIKSTLSSLQSLKNRSSYEESNQREDIPCEDEIDGLKLFESMQERRTQSQLSGGMGVSCVSSSFEDAVKSLSDNPTISREISYTKKFLMDIEEEERNNPPSKISFPLFVVLATVLLQVAVRILVIVQNFRRSLPWRRRRSTRNGLIQFSDIPFTIGRSMSSSGCSFRIFSFLNRWLESNVDDNPQHDCSPDISPLLLRAVSIDRISINSSHLVMKQPGQQPSAMSQLSWFGIRLEGIDVRVTILLKRKSRRVGEREVSTSNYLQSVSLQLQVGALEVGIFPCIFDWCRGSGIKMNARAFFDVRASDIPAYGKHSNLSGFGLSGTLSHLFICRSLKGARAKSRDAVVSWDKMQSSLHLHLQTVFDSGSDGRHSQRLTASSVTLPSGFCLVHNSRKGSTWIKPSPLSRRVHMNLGNQFTLGINLEHVQKILSLLKDTPSPLIKNFSANDQHATHKKSKKKSSIQVVELNSVISMQLFTFISKPRDKRDIVTLDFLSLESPNFALLWRNNDESLPDSTGDQIQRDAKQGCDVPYSLLVARTKYISLQHDVFYGDQLDCSFAVRDLVRLNQVQVKVGDTHDQCQKRERSKSAIIDLGGIFIRADRKDVNQLTYTMKALVDTKPLLADLQSRAKETKQTLSSNTKLSMIQHSDAVNGSKKTTREALSYIQFSCDSVDVIVELPASPEIVTIDDITSNDKVRVALLQTETKVTISINRENPNKEESGDLDQSNLDLNLPDQLFDFGVKRCAHHHLIDASLLRAEGSVTFLPHLSLPVILEASQNVNERPHGCSQEVSFHGEFSMVALKSTVPLNSRLNDVRSVFICFDALNIYERFGKKLEVGTSLFSIPVHKFSFQPDFSKPQETDWPMAQTYTLYVVADFVKILHCRGSFCMTDERNIETGERTESISVQFSRGSAELEVVWSPILQWLEVSCNSRIQRALACLRIPGSKKDVPKRTFSSHKTNVHISVDCNVTAKVHAYVGVESYLCAVIEGGSTMNISMAKYPSSSSTNMKEVTKPNLSFEAKQIEFHVNGWPICVIEGISLQNYHRRAYYNEINEYCNTNTSPIDYYGDELVSDHDGHPLKEIFELRVGSSIAVQFPPALHFGQVIEDMTLVPKALFDGLNRLKGDHKQQRKKYPLMSMKCTIPFLDISLMGYDPGSERSTGTVTNILRDELHIFFEALEVSIERNEPPSRTQARINSLDEDDSSTHVYGPQIQGGFICLTVKHVVCILYPLNLVNPLLRMDEFAVNGYLHLAALSPTTPGVQGGKTVTSLLLCHHNHSTGNCLSSHQHRQCSCRYGVSLHSAGLPVKIYIDGQVKSGGLNLMFGSVLSDSISRLMECIERLLPPPPKSGPDHEVAMKLTWWDSVRFFIHGSISISADELSFRWLLDSYVFWDHSIMFYCQKCEMRYTVGLFKVDASDINVSIPGTAYDMSVHPSVRDAKSSFHLPHQAESVVSRERHPLLYVPLLKAQVNISWEMLHSGGVCHEHHSVCMKIKSDEEVRRSDKFALFRTDGVNVQLWIELPGSDSIGADNWVALRVDVLPWFTHVNSTSSLSPQAKEKDSKPFPTFRSVVVKASVKNMKMATWFEDEEDVDGMCLTVKAVKYSASLDGGKEIVIEGPAKAALLDVSEFSHVVNIVGDHQEKNDDVTDNELIASEFGTVRSLSNSEVKQISSQKESFHREDVNSSLFLKLPFLKLQELSSHIHELDYIVIVSKIDICNQSMGKILDVPSQERRTTLDGRESQSSTWSILVARCRLLWTIEIRDSIMGISKDLIYTFGFMNSQLRQMQVVSKETSEQKHNTGETCGAASSFVGKGIELSRRDSFNKSRLEYLLAEDGGAPRRRPALHAGQIQAASFDEKKKEGRNSTIPTLDIHFSNPQVQLHSIATGGSIILAIERAQVEAREFIHFIVPNARSKDGKVSPSNLLKKTENTYTLTNMEAYSISTRVDVNLGLPWLEVCSPEGYRRTHSADVDERDHSSLCHQNIYPPHLHHHEPLPFSKSGLLRPILNKFTFQSTQIFHRPPHHNSTQELIDFINQGLVVGQDDAAVDNIELLIDLLNFNLDSYQFKTTLDVLRNVLLEVPKPHQRHQSLDQDDTTTKSSGGIRSVAATEMEQLLSGDIKYRDKKGRQMLRTAAMSLLREIEDRIALEGSEVFRRISYTLGKLQWNMQNQDVIDDVQISFTGFNGQHDYSRDGSIISQFSLEDVRISSSKPGPDSIGFLDPTSVVKSVLGNARSACDQCGQYFDHSNNDLFSCVFHRGKYDYGVWTCCKATNSNASGCKSGPHSGKERAAVIRVESLPQVVGRLSLYSHFEVNLFPGIPHTLMIQISKSMSRLLKSYFFVEDDHDEEFDAVSTFSDSTGSNEAISMQSDYLPKSTIRRKSPSIGAQGAPSSGNQCIPGGSTELDSKSSELKSPSKAAEVVLFKVWRVGYVDVNVSVGGFKRLPQASSIDICVPAYSKAYEIGTWEFHGKKYLTHVVREVLKSGASSGLDKFRRKVMGGSSNTSIGQSGDQLEPILESSSPNSSPHHLPPILDSSASELGSFIGKHLFRPMGAADILGTPAKKRKKKLFG